MKDLHELFVDKLSKLHTTEKALLDALKKLSDAATNNDLKMALDDHRSQTETHVARLEAAASSLGEDLRSKDDSVIVAITKEADKMLTTLTSGDVKDAAIIAAAQTAEHYEIACYGTAAAWAKSMNHMEAQSLFHETLEEEKAADDKLTGIAQGGLLTVGVNDEASQE